MLQSYSFKSMTYSKNLLTNMTVHILNKYEINFKYNRSPAANISYSSSAAAVVFGGHLSARAAFRLDK
jgi:hypothetical protein